MDHKAEAVYVVWHDAQSDDGWEDVAESLAARQKGHYKVEVSFGYVLEETELMLTLAGDISAVVATQEVEETNRRMDIPKNTIVKIVPIPYDMSP